MDVVTLGESMVLLSPSKIGLLTDVQQFHKHIGGAESNVAIALARLGHKVGWISKLGHDSFGISVRNTIRGEGVDTSKVVFDKNRNTGVFFKERFYDSEPNIYYYRSNSAASHINDDDIDMEYIKRAKVIHLTGITPCLSESNFEIIKKIISEIKGKQTIVFDPNIRFKLMTEDDIRNKVLPIANQADVVLPGIDEGRILTGERAPEKIAEYFLEKGVKLVVIKLGKDGAYYSDRDNSRYIEAVEVEQIVDTVGAGDGFAAGIISGLLNNLSIDQTVMLANKIGASALSSEGDYEGYPYKNEMEECSSIRYNR